MPANATSSKLGTGRYRVAIPFGLADLRQCGCSVSISGNWYGCIQGYASSSTDFDVTIRAADGVTPMDATFAFTVVQNPPPP
jgi:hypothetical protein